MTEITPEHLSSEIAGDDVNRYRDVLNEAKMATFDRVPNTTTAHNWVMELQLKTLHHEDEKHCRKRARKGTDAKKLLDAIGALSADLIKHSDNEESQGFFFRPADKDELALTLVSYQNFKNLTTYWSEMGWIERTGFIDARQEWDGQRLDQSGYQRARRFRATVEFIRIAQEHQITAATIPDHFEKSHDRNNLVQVRETKSGGTHKPFGAKVMKMGQGQLTPHRKVIQQLNNTLREHKYNLKDTPMVRRTFNCGDRAGFNFDLGGRLYCASDDNWMQKGKEERASITIDGEKTLEIDVSASQLFILYALCGQKLNYDLPPYNISGYPRLLTKGIIVAAIGKGDMPSRWPRKLNEDFLENHGELPSKSFILKDIVNAIYSRHPVLRKLKENELDWANLQYEEAECFVTAMQKLGDENIPALPVYDSLIVKESDLEIAYSAIEQSYIERFGHKPNVTISNGIS
ncbi:hypothetical protein [Sulfitobacter geojensis]|uniref:hypothetical protein n=1 Tax=Sulfitobacter geojensis TaxID=1342299 RepID=UPI002493B9FA|nr:hypothetical protein [Sulfitobacter geojensis]